MKSTKKIYFLLIILLNCFLLIAEQRGIGVKGTSSNELKSYDNLVIQKGHNNTIGGMDFSSDGKYLISASEDNTVKLWNVKTGQEIKTLTFSDWANDVKFLPDNKTVVIATGNLDEGIVFWNIYTNEQKSVNTENFSQIKTLDILNNGKTVVAGTFDKKIVFVDVRTTSVQNILEGHSDHVRSLDCSADSKYIISGAGQGEIILWDAKKASLLSIIAKEKEYINRVRISPDNKYAFWIAGSKLKIYDIKKKKIYKEFDDYVFNAEFTPNGKFLLTGDCTLYSFPEMEKQYHKYETLDDGLTISKDGSIVAGSSTDHKIKIVNLFDGEKILETKGRHNVNDIQVSEKQSLIPITILDNLFFVDMETGVPKVNIVSQGIISSVQINKDQTLLATNCYNNDNTILDIKGNKVKKFEKRVKTGSESLCWSPDGKYIAISDNKLSYIEEETKGIVVYEYETKKVVSELYFPNKEILQLKFTNDGKSLFFISEGELYKWNLTSTRAIKVNININTTNSLVICQNSDTLIVAGQEVCFLNTKTLQEKSFFTIPGVAYGLALNSDESLLAIANQDNNIQLVNTKTGEIIKEITGHTGYVSTVKFMNNDKQLVSGSEDGIVKFWDIETGKCLLNAIYEENNEYLLWTDEGYFMGSDNAIKTMVTIVDGLDVYGIDQLYEKLFRPDIIAARLAGLTNLGIEQNFDIASVIQTGKAPTALLELYQSTTKNRDVNVQIKVTDNGGGIGKVYVKLNERNFLIASECQSTQGQTLSFDHVVTLQTGENILGAFATNKSETIESEISSTKITWNGEKAKPRLFLLVIAADKYRAQGMQLKYSVADAEGIISSFTENKGNLYESIEIVKLYDTEVTKEKIENTFTQLTEEIKADDVFIFYLAGHGTTTEEDGDYYYLPVNFRYTGEQAIQDQGISKKDITKSLSGIKAEKTLIILDTCSSGAFLKGSRNGLSEATAIQRLSKATGQATLAASSDMQVAMEGYNGHGIFTYTLMDGIKGAADMNKDSFITLQELSNYVEYEVPERSYEKWGYEQVPQKILREQDFPIASK